ncbi:MAG: diguanylate cyclase [Gammaproteobacteria bacterium]|nr:diguanylate cyclase [Gammaproteobacteria bacterium]
MSILVDASSSFAADTPVKIGVLAHREESLKLWSPTAEYLTHAIPGYKFVIEPYDNASIGPAVERGEVDFVLTNPGSYVELETKYGVTRMLTLRNRRQGNAYTVFGAVIFTRAARADIQQLTDLKGKSFMAVDKNAFGGFLMGWREFKDQGIDPFRDFSELKFVGLPQDPIVTAVRDGKIDAGMVRTDTLERMAMDGKINLADFRILNPQQTAGFPFALSTRLYPEWPFSRVRTTPDGLAQKVAIALLSLPPDSAAAKASRSAGWTVPLDYNSVHELYKTLQVGPYQDYGKASLADILRQYWRWLALMAVMIVLMLINTAYILKLNRHLKKSQKQLIEITHQLENSNKQLEKLSLLDGLTGIANHRHFQDLLNKEWRWAQRHGTPLTLLMLDIDFFKKFNDSAGHPAGDECLKKVARALYDLARRPRDLVARYGGEEFTVVLPGTDTAGAVAVAERMRAAVEKLAIPNKGLPGETSVTVSIGVASAGKSRHATPTEIIAAADKALYEAKETGRNCVRVAASD